MTERTPDGFEGPDFDALEASEFALVNDLRACAIKDTPHLANKVVRRVKEDAQGRELLLPAAIASDLDSLRLSDSVMQRITEQASAPVSQPKNGENRREGRFLRLVTHIGAAAAAAIVVALLYAPVSNMVWPDQPAKPAPAASLGEGPNEKAEAGKSAPAANFAPAQDSPIQAQVRYSRDYGGHKLWVVDAGAIEGVRVGDVLLWRGANGVGGELSVVGISPHYAMCKRLVGAEDGPQPKDHVTASRPTARMTAARASLSGPSLPEGALYGLGAFVERRTGGLFVTEVIPAYWEPHKPAPEASHASRLGLERGDRLVTIMGQSVLSELDVSAALARSGSDGTRLFAEVERAGKRMRLQTR